MDTLIELFGYLGSTMVVVSMLMSSVVKLRVLNTIGSIISGTYALIIGSFPLALMNGCLVAINLYNLRRLLVTKQQYVMLECGREDAFLRYFLDSHRQDIAIYFPDFTDEASVDRIELVLCNGDPAGILLARRTGDGALDVVLEYTTPMYRDCSIGKFLYDALAQEGVQELRVDRASEKHAPYLKKMGYAESSGGYCKQL